MLKSLFSITNNYALLLIYIQEIMQTEEGNILLFPFFSLSSTTKSNKHGKTLQKNQEITCKTQKKKKKVKHYTYTHTYIYVGLGSNKNMFSN